MGKATLKHVLKKFLALVDELELRRKDGDDQYQREFATLKELTESFKCDRSYSCSEGLKDVNRRKNRYRDILPYNYTRVVLSEYPGVPGSDYINANYVRGSTGSSCAYIASQGPLPNTTTDFWRLIWETEVTLIIMACNERESGKYKCEVYWPQSPEEDHQYGNITVKLIKWRQVCPDFLVRTFRIQQDTCERTVCQFHYTTWPDHGVPPHVHPILELVRLMRDVQATEARPILVHCSAGCGRTGTICCIDYVWALLRTGKLKEDFCLFDLVADLRRQRIAMVQTYEQYVLCYHAVAALFEQQLKMIDAHTYENLDEDGQPILFRSLRDSGDDEARNSSSVDSSEDFNDSTPAIAAQPHLPEELAVSQVLPPPPQPFEQHQPQATAAAASSAEYHHDGSVEALNNSFNTSLICGRSSPSPDHKQERLVGKATVIRRPSIAKLKAMFENIQTADTTPPQEIDQPRSPTGPSLLQRSHSTRERSSAGLSTARSILKTDDMALVRQQHAAVINEVQALLGASIAAVENAANHSRATREESSASNGRKMSETSDTATDDDLYGYATAGSVPNEVTYLTDDPIGPPKPPRAYQYIVTTNRVEDNDNGNLNAIGRIIYTVASPKPNFAPLDDARITAMQRTAPYQRHTSTPNLAAAFSNMPLSVPGSAATAAEAKLSRPTALHPAASTQAVNRDYGIYQPLMRNPMPTGEEIYQPLPVQRDPMMNPYGAVGPAPPGPPQFVRQQYEQQRKLIGDSIVTVPRRELSYPMMRPVSQYEGIYDVSKGCYPMNPMKALTQADQQQKQLADQAYYKYIAATHNAKLIQQQQQKQHMDMMMARNKQLRDEGALKVQQQQQADSSKQQVKESETKGQSEPKKNHSSFTLPAIFGGKSKAKKKQQEKVPTSKSVPGNLAGKPTGNLMAKPNAVHPTNVRPPPQAHRFAPPQPTQWTQV